MEKYHFDTNTKELSISGKKIDFNSSNYKLDSEIEHGANGIVLKGYDSELNRTVAIKFWLPHRSETLPDYNKYKNEIEKISQLDSDKIVKIHYASTIQDNYYYAVYEFIQGKPLREWLSMKQDFDSRCFVLEQIYTEMIKIHKIGIYHGDLHQGNVLITPSNDVKIIDFGTSFFAKTPEDSKKREAHLLIDTGLSILEEEYKRCNFLKIDVLKVSPPECAPFSILMLNEVIQELNKLDGTQDDYTERSVALGVAHFICERPFFILENVLEFLQNSTMDENNINYFVGAVFSNCMHNIGDKFGSYPVSSLEANGANIELLEKNYQAWHEKYLNDFTTRTISDN